MKDLVSNLDVCMPVRLPTNKEKLEMSHMKYAQGLGASLRYATELKAVRQPGRLVPLRSSNLHEDILTGNLGPSGVGSNQFKGIREY